MLYIWDMINHKELRWGNLVQDDWGRIQEVLWFDNSGVETEHARFQHEELFPIPLSGEILEKLGFELSRGAHVLEDWVWMEGTLYKEEYNDWTHSLGHINSVHQLQNLYFFYEGEELTYTP
jgi:hypothetical protein